MNFVRAYRSLPDPIGVARKSWVVFFALMLGFFLQSGFTVEAEEYAMAPIRITDVRIGEHPNKTRVVLDIQGRSDAKVFSLDDPARLVIDVPNGLWAVPFQSGERAGGAISSIRYGRLNRNMARLVLDLNYPVKLASRELLVGKNANGARLVLDLQRAGQSTVDPISKAPAPEVEPVPETPDAPAAAVEAEEPKVPDEAPAEEIAQKAPVIPEAKPEDPLYVLDDPEAVETDEDPKLVIVIDPGHGGRDPGAIGYKGTKEAEVVLGAAKALKAHLDKKKRYKTVLTRNNNSSLKLRNRIAVARKADADLFISLHADSLPEAKKVRGASAYTLSKKASDAEAGALARKENQADVLLGVDLTTHSAEVNDILIDLALSHTKNASVRFAGMVLSELGDVTPLVKSPQKSAGFVVLKSPDVPSVLVELGYLSNLQDEKNLNSAAWRTKTAKAIGTAIDQYFGYAEVSQIGG